MKTKLTKRSQHDGTLVTIPVAQFDYSPDFYVYRDSLSVGEEVVIVIDDVPTVCTLARPGKDGVPTVMTTRGLPRHIRLPRVGRPVYVEVSEIR